MEAVKKDRWNVGCPFYQWDNCRNKIACEGAADGSSLHWVFRKKSDFTIHINTFCCDKYKNCEIYQVVNAKYEEG